MTARIYRTLTEVDNLKTYSLVLGLLTCWFITHPYFGIRHDGLLYAVQALSHLYPKAFENDIFRQKLQLKKQVLMFRRDNFSWSDAVDFGQYFRSDGVWFYLSLVTEGSDITAEDERKQE